MLTVGEPTDNRIMGVLQANVENPKCPVKAANIS